MIVKLVLTAAKVTVSSLLFIYVSVPVIVKTNPWILKEAVFLNRLISPYHNLDNPNESGLKFTRQLFVVNEELKLGVWHTYPEDSSEIFEKLSTEGFPINSEKRVLQENVPIFLYLHGNSADRAQPHRVELYKMLSSALNAHVIAVDYRGFGDSEGAPHNENDVISDASAVFKWLHERTVGGKSKIYIWGHSLGTGISTKLVYNLQKANTPPAALILESPFTNLRDAAVRHPFSWPFRFIPWFEWLFLDPISDTGIHLDTDKTIVHIECPILILHAKDDLVVPFDLGEKLYGIVQKSRSTSSSTVKFVPFDAKFGYGHKYISRAPELPNIVKDFIKD